MFFNSSGDVRTVPIKRTPKSGNGKPYKATWHVDASNKALRLREKINLLCGSQQFPNNKFEFISRENTGIALNAFNGGEYFSRFPVKFRERL